MSNSSDPVYERYVDMDFTDAMPVAEVPALAKLQAERGEISTATKDQNNLLPSPITEFYDDQERELYELVEGEGFLPDEVNEKRKHELRGDARSMLGEKQISIRLPEYNFVQIRRIAEREGITYQMLISSVLHNFINKTLVHK